VKINNANLDASKTIRSKKEASIEIDEKNIIKTLKKREDKNTNKLRVYNLRLK
jgi:hypothetical protein